MKDYISVHNVPVSLEERICINKTKCMVYINDYSWVVDIEGYYEFYYTPNHFIGKISSSQMPLTVKERLKRYYKTINGEDILCGQTKAQLRPAPVRLESFEHKMQIGTWYYAQGQNYFTFDNKFVCDDMYVAHNERECSFFEIDAPLIHDMLRMGCQTRTPNYYRGIFDFPCFNGINTKDIIIFPFDGMGWDAELWTSEFKSLTESMRIYKSRGMSDDIRNMRAEVFMPIFTTTNIAADHNQLTMEIMQKVARKHDFVCLLHEKPFEGVNGSGKHNNWSISTDTGINLLDPGETPRDNASFLLFLTAVISAVDTYQDLLRLSVASAGNDHRLGANEAPPAIISIFLGSELTEILDSIVEDRPYGSKEKEIMKIGVHVLPRFPKDTTDRNRTSPFAFTGNKFEFRMLGSAASIALANTVLNAAVAEVLSQFADKLEGVSDFDSALHDLIKSEITAHKRVLFNGNGYDDSWVAEAEKRGLSNYKTLPDAVKHYLDPKNVELFTKHKVYSEVEMKSRHEIFLEKYCKLLNIEYQTMSVMAKQDILPAVSAYASELASDIAAIESAGGSADFEKETFAEVSADMNAANKSLKALNKLIADLDAIDDYEVLADKIKDEMIPAMDALRANCDKLELETAAEYWPFPTYGELLFGVR